MEMTILWEEVKEFNYIDDTTYDIVNIEIDLLQTAYRDGIEEMINYNLFALNKEMNYDTDVVAEIKSNHLY
jgi:hypothetical protein